ncbi:DoxX family protein [Actinomycetospora aeridis]|uniref:DoxX family protein n=1 Tax=Actinomycetospora aeridis TaxID=3129231 RepID=A0ABU8N1I0_9PSEU
MILTEPTSSQRTPGRAAAVTARVCTGLVTVFLLFVAFAKLTAMPMMVDTTVHKMGFPPESMPVTGAVLVISLVLYLWRRTEILGAILLTAVVGGAVAVHMRISAPLVPDFAVVVGFGALVWLPLYLRNDLVRRMVHAGR